MQTCDTLNQTCETMPLSRNKIKYLNALQIKKYRNLHGQFIIEGDKLVSDVLREGETSFRQLIATREWISQNQVIIQPHLAAEVIEADALDIARISSLETPSPVIAVLDIKRSSPDMPELFRSWSLLLDDIRDPGNMGTIIRTADWFGIRHIICSQDCVDCYNPKVVQSSMGALLHVNVHYADLVDVLGAMQDDPSFRIYGTFMTGIPVYDVPPATRGMIIFGNESRGISSNLQAFIQLRITIPSSNPDRHHIESLNVASSVAIVCSYLVSK